MKKYIFLILSLSFSAFSQKAEISGVTGATIGGAWRAKAYTSQAADTSIATSPQDYTYFALALEVKDSASVAVYFIPSFDGVTFYPRVLIDSLSSANNAGNNYAFALPSWALSCKSIKWNYVFQNTFRIGTSSATFNAQTVKKK